mmetsp:Transcript_53003/g.125151  ORF Transcript_53003/g.125151 Transcript_53003/m.125151 type:complete len:181 (+) Transcript_53003:10-552(+)
MTLYPTLVHSDASDNDTMPCHSTHNQINPHHIQGRGLQDDEQEVPAASMEETRPKSAREIQMASNAGLVGALLSKVVPGGDLEKLRDRGILGMQQRPQVMRDHISTRTTLQRYTAGPSAPANGCGMELVSGGDEEDEEWSGDGAAEPQLGEVRGDARNRGSNGARSADLVFGNTAHEVAL